MKKTIENLADVFYGQGDYCDFGCSDNDLDRLWHKTTKLPYGTKSVYAVKDWVWHDVVLEDNTLDIVKADYVLRTNSRKFDVGDWIRTSPIIKFTDNCVCETGNSFYILVGKGLRKESNGSIFNFIG